MLRISQSDKLGPEPTEPSGTCKIELTRHSLTLPNLPSALSGTTVVQLSDLHCGNGKVNPLIEAAVKHANALHPDYVVVTGDFVDKNRSDIIPVVQMLRGLRARRGLLGVLGNHDYYADGPFLESALTASGFTMLTNRSVELAPGLWMAGVDDLLEGFVDLPHAMSSVPEAAALVFLAHHPNLFDNIDAGRPQLMLSGHTHGGQFHFPLIHPSVICKRYLKTNYVHGWYHRDRSMLYVSRGIGVAGWGPMARRVRCRPEVSMFTLLSDVRPG